MEWRDEGFVLTARRHGESSAVLEVFTAAHGRHAGVVRGGASRRMAPLLQPGARLALVWSARLEEQLGAFRVDPIESRTAVLLGDGAALAALSSMAALVSAALPERDAHPRLYVESLAVIDSLATAPDWPARYAAWELALLAELGFGLDLACCAVTGAIEDLLWVSPRSGRAVSRSAGTPWADRLLPLPGFLREGWPPDAAPEAASVAEALALTGHFLEARLAPGLPRGTLPAARGRAVAALLAWRATGRAG